MLYNARLECGHVKVVEIAREHGPGYDGHHTPCDDCKATMAVLDAKPADPAEPDDAPEAAAFVQAAEPEGTPAVPAE